MHVAGASPLPPIASTLADRHVLLTGVTGFLAKVWLAHTLLNAPQIGRITLLVRPRRGQTGRRRVEEMLDTNPAFRPLRKRHGPGWEDFVRARLAVVEGDLEAPRLGIDDATITRLAGDVDAVVHCAGLTDFQPDPVVALATNVEGARGAADLALALDVPLLHVSTAFVAGVQGGIVEETATPGVAPCGDLFDVEAEIRGATEAFAAVDPGLGAKGARVAIGQDRARALGWPNIYTWSKGLAEQVLLAKPGLRLAIVRPSIVECALATPFLGWNEGLNTSAPIVWLMSRSFRRLPAHPDNAFDVVPVDLTARGMTLALTALLRGEAQPVYHLATSDKNRVSFERMLELNNLAVRRAARRDPDKSTFERLILPQLDSRTDPEGASRDRIRTFRDLAKRARRAVRSLDLDKLPAPVAELAGDTLADLRKRADRRLSRTALELGRIDGMLEAYKPFLADTNWTFRTDHIDALTARLSDEDARTFGFDARVIDWRDYWLNVQYPGLQTWSIPLLEGREPASDPPSDPPLCLADRPALERTA